MSTAAKKLLQYLPLGQGVSLLTSDDNGLAALAKPVGVLAHPNTPNEEDRSLLMCRYDIKNEYYEWKDGQGHAYRVWLLNRLDSATSGVILLSADEELAYVMRSRFRQKQVRKIYAALVFGRTATPYQLWKDRLDVQKRGGRIRTKTQGNLPSQCRMNLLDSKGSISLLQLEPITGRSHQLRVQCAKRHFPIIGDATYGDFTRNREFARSSGDKRLFLHSLETAFEYEFHGRKNHFKATAPLPPEFRAVLAKR